MFSPVQIALGADLHAFYDQIVPNTPALESFAARGFGQCFAWAPARMVDQAAELLAAWQTNDSQQATTKPPKLPVCLVAMAKNFEPMGHDFGIQHSEPVDVLFPEDVKERYFKVRLMAGDLRAQLAFFASDVSSAQSLAAQYLLYIDPPARRRLWARYPFAGFEHRYPVQIDMPDSPAISVDTNSRVVTCLAIDLTLKVTIPFFMAPGPDEPNDGKGTPGTDDPAGYQVVLETPSEWTEVPR